MIRFFVFDTNSLISAHLLKKSTARDAYNKALKKGILVYSSETLREFAEVFTRSKFDRYLLLEDRMKSIDTFQGIPVLNAGDFLKHF